ncbi:MAG: bifunctional 2-C-methyl-D-erythritol 4-phosphate cytidylyltransferase/2-C-methyl-D-erythritol 2,4-cyclodiphosphate synthase [Campylobacter sp.]|nr:bifunctional 2-C-methyl-D-erythritol 4-phosphate cytidylyltransferase/2-C-methyl-D-erythritol 2,4-cyclodiphosphate synthase [Campylobacter sp.]
MQMKAKKQWLRSGHDPLWLVVAKNFTNSYKFKTVIIVGASDELNLMREFEPGFEYINGGDSRQISLKNALDLVKTEYVMVSDIARAEIPSLLIKTLIKECDKFDCISPYLSVNDTTYQNSEPIKRESLKLIQTPQISKTSLLKTALKSGEIFTDDSMAIKSIGGNLGFIKGDERAFKITTKNDLLKLNLKAPSSECFVGNGYDVHKFKSGNGLMICGVKVPCEYSFEAHSDGDVALHALTDALLGACGLGDIGEFYPDNDPKFKGISSITLLKDSLKRVRSYGYEVVNADITIIAQTPKLSSYKHQMKEVVSEILGTNRVNVKATTTEGLGFVGEKKGIAAQTSITLKYLNWTEI